MVLEKSKRRLGRFRISQGDYIVIPIGTIYRVTPDPGESKFLVVETFSWISTPERYRNEFGQLLEHSPFCERDIRTPETFSYVYGNRRV